MKRATTSLLLTLGVVLAVPAAACPAVALTVTPTAASAIPAPWTNCTTLNKKYPHGLGKAGAKDKTSGEPVTTFKRSTKLYNLAMSHNRGLDRDKDGIACETA